MSEVRSKLGQLFELRGSLPKRTKLLCEVCGTILLLAIWSFITEKQLVPKGILPSPWSILKSFKELHFEDALVRNLGFSIKINALGYLEAVAITIPLGFLIGLIPLFRAMTERYISASRFIPLTGLVGLFICWFGIGSFMKIQFLAFSIFIYLLPVVIQRIDEVQTVHLQMVRTLGASKWQTITSVYLPDVFSRVFDDIRVLTALSWTYIIVVEIINTADGGIGALAYLSSRQSRTDKVFAILIVIMLVGLIQDQILKIVDRFLFPHKYVTKEGK